MQRIKHETARSGKEVVDTHTEFYDNPYAEFEVSMIHMASRGIAKTSSEYKKERVDIVDEAISNLVGRE